jgi:hypothetical protein
VYQCKTFLMISSKRGIDLFSSKAGAWVLGGLGSGSYYRFGSKDRTEDCLSLDVRNWQRDGWLETALCFTTSWWRRYRKDSSVGVRVLGDAGAGRAYTVELSYSWGLDGREEDISYPISLSKLTESGSLYLNSQS